MAYMIKEDFIIYVLGRHLSLLDGTFVFTQFIPFIIHILFYVV